MVTTDVRKRTAQFITEQKTATSPEGRRSSGGGKRGRKDRKPRSMSPNSLANLEKGRDTQFKPGQSGNPGGLPGYDVPGYLARRAFEQNQEAVYRGMAERLMAGEPYAFKEFADRGYGKLKETRSLELSGKITLEQALEAERRAERELNGNGGN